MRGTGSEWPRGGERQRDNIVLWLLPPPSAPAQGCREGASTMRTQHHPCVQPRVSSWHHWHPVVSMAGVCSAAGVFPVLGNAAGYSPGCSPSCYAWAYTHFGRSPALSASPSSLGTGVTHQSQQDHTHTGYRLLWTPGHSFRDAG